MGWPKSSKEYEKIYLRMYEYMKMFKSTVRLSFDKAKHGGKKNKGNKKGKDTEEKVIENLVVFVALSYPDWQN